MITEKEIRARFHKMNLRKLAHELLAEMYDGKPRYELRPGVTPADIEDGVRFAAIDRRPGSPFALLNSRTLNRGRWIEDDSLRLRLRSDCTGYDVLAHYINCPTDADKVDCWIKHYLMTKDRWVKDTTAIDIYI